MMKKIFLLLVCAIGITSLLNAQGVRRSTFRVDAPAALAGEKIIDEATYVATSTAPWSVDIDIDSSYEGIPIKYDPANLNGCNTAGFTPGFFDSSFALIYRGDCEFGQKALRAQNAGAVGVIIVNNLLGVVGMAGGTDGANVTIPVVMVTKETGDAIRNQLALSNQVTASLAAWYFDTIVNPIDVSIKNDGPIHPQGKAMPAHQLDNSLFPDDNFQLYPGGRWYNFSVVNFDTFYTKTSIYGPGIADSLTEITFNTDNWTPIDDSIIFTIIDSNQGSLSGFDLNNAAIGEYTVSTEIGAGQGGPNTEVGLNSGNNTWQYNFDVTDSIYSKGGYDVDNARPKVNSYIALNGAVDYEWGPLLYIRNGGYAARQLECVIMRDIIQDSVFTGQDVILKIYEWSDNDANGAVNDLSEMIEVGNGVYSLQATDIVPIEGLPIKVAVDNINTPGFPVKLSANTYYWVTIGFTGNLTNAFGIGLDYYADYSANLLNWPPLDPTQGSPLWSITDQQMFGGGFADAGSPAVALHMSKNVDPTSVNDVNQFAGDVSIYPNPTSDVLNIALTLKEMSKNVNYQIVDVTGKTISTVDRKNVDTEVYSVNTNAMAAGSYFLKITTDNGVRTEKFTVTK